MKNKRDLWIMAMTSLLIAIVLFVGIGVGTRRQQQAQVQKLEDDLFHGRSESVRHLVSATDVLSHEPNLGNTLVCGVLYCDPATVQMLIDKGVKVNSRVVSNEKETSATATGFTAMDYAVIHRRADMVEVLLRNGADANLKTYGHSAIELLKNPPNIYIERGAKRVGTDAQIAHLLREAQHKPAVYK